MAYENNVPTIYIYTNKMSNKKGRKSAKRVNDN